MKPSVVPRHVFLKALRKLPKSKRRNEWLMNIANCLILVLLLLSGCAGITPINEMPSMILGEPSFYPTIAAHTDASIIAGNRVELLFNGDQIFPAMLQAIRGARKSITYQQYFFEDGAIAHEMAEAFAERCRAGVKVKILIDSLGGGSMPQDIQDLWKKSGCQLEWFQRIKVFQFITPWELLSYNHRSHRRILVIDGKIGFTGGHGVSDAWSGNGRTGALAPNRRKSRRAHCPTTASRLRRELAESDRGRAWRRRLFSGARFPGESLCANSQKLASQQQLRDIPAILALHHVGTKKHPHREPVFFPR